MDQRPRVAGLRRAIGLVLIALALAVVVLQLRTRRIGDPPIRASIAPVPTGAVMSPADGSNPHDVLVLIAAGDIACAPGSSATSTGCHQAATSKLIAASPGVDPIAVLLLGDTQYESGRSQEYASFDATWGAALRAMPETVIAPVAGNHEWYDPDAPRGTCTFQHDGRAACGFESYFGDAAFAGDASDGAGNYARIFAKGSAHPLVVIMIDAGVCEHDQAVCAADGTATRFLAATLQDARVNPPSACTIVAWHQARWSDVGHGNIDYVDPLWRALFHVPSAQRPDLVLNGHDHVYERMRPLGPGGQPDPGGIPEIVAGAGGREISGVPYTGAVPSRAAFVDLQHFWVLRIEHDPVTGGLTTSFHADSEVAVDRLNMACRT